MPLEEREREKGGERTKNKEDKRQERRTKEKKHITKERKVENTRRKAESDAPALHLTSRSTSLQKRRRKPSRGQIQEKCKLTQHTMSICSFVSTVLKSMPPNADKPVALCEVGDCTGGTVEGVVGCVG